MANRKQGGRAWSAKAAAKRLERDIYADASNRCGETETDAKHLARAYLAGWRAALNGDGSIDGYALECVRLGIVPKSGEGRK